MLKSDIKKLHKNQSLNLYLLTFYIWKALEMHFLVVFIWSKLIDKCQRGAPEPRSGTRVGEGRGNIKHVSYFTDSPTGQELTTDHINIGLDPPKMLSY